ncbi:LLM class flavin-dependent oxidoreductase [Viridibacillus sp. FSL H8-0110]|uniref:LLM class flavin-dependent oxidoreductase n=1 Tax=Viridibacillus sp. FSL H8-0110 TaxID=2921376 RepID=UPI0030FC7F55
MKLSVLDQAPVTGGNEERDAVTKAVELAVLADELGYHRMWMAEHHSSRTFVSAAPEIIVSHIASRTKNLRVGTGGTMMMHYSPLKMAEVFKTLSALTPGRIDFGAGRAPGGDQLSILALSEGRQPMYHNMYEEFETTLQLINDEVPTEDLYKQTIAAPSSIVLPEAWLLGSSGNSALKAGSLGVGYSFAQFFNGKMSKEIFDTYRKSFKPSVYMEKSEINVCYMVTTAETREEAEFEAGPYDLFSLFFMRGQIIPMMTPEEAQNYQLTEMEKMQIQDNRRRHQVGSVKEIATFLEEEQAKYGFDEAMICSIPNSQEKRLEVYSLLARELL